MSMIGRWVYETPKRYGDDTTYLSAAQFLDGFGPIEDWGCGGAYARRFFRLSAYRGIDGSGPFADTIEDLAAYRSSGHNILLRHVLEHNVLWKSILQNAIDSFQQRMVIILFTPYSLKTRILRVNRAGIPDISFSREDIYELVRPCLIKEDTFITQTEYGMESALYLERKG